MAPAKKNYPLDLNKRERQIMDVIYRRGSATALEVMDELTDLPSYSASKAMLRLLEQKGHLKHSKQGAKYVYFPAVSREKMRRPQLKHLMQTFFEGSIEAVVADLVDISEGKMSDDELERIMHLIEQAKKEGR